MVNSEAMTQTHETVFSSRSGAAAVLTAKPQPVRKTFKTHSFRKDDFFIIDNRIKGVSQYIGQDDPIPDIVQTRYFRDQDLHTVGVHIVTENIWVAADRLVRLTLDGEVSGLYDLKDKPTDLLFDGNELWVASSWGRSVTRVTRDGEVVDTYDVGGWASDLTFDGESIWVTNMTDDVVVKLPAGR